jgi:hypothetical protein
LAISRRACLEDIGLGPGVGDADTEARHQTIHGVRPLAFGGGLDRLDLAVCQRFAGHAKLSNLVCR